MGDPIGQSHAFRQSSFHTLSGMLSFGAKLTYACEFYNNSIMVVNPQDGVYISTAPTNTINRLPGLQNYVLLMVQYTALQCG